MFLLLYGVACLAVVVPAVDFDVIVVGSLLVSVVVSDVLGWLLYLLLFF